MLGLEPTLFEILGEPEEVTSGISELKRNIAYFEENYNFLLEHYKNQWVGVAGQKVFVHDRRYKPVVGVLRETGLLDSAYVQFLDPKSRTQIIHEAELSMSVGV